MTRQISRITQMLYASRHRDVINLYHQFLESQWWTRHQLEDLQSQKLQSLVKHAYNNVPYYRELMIEHGLRAADINCPGDLQKLPVTKKSSMKSAVRNGKALAADFNKHRSHVSYSSGSTGSSLRLHRGKEAQVIVAALQHRFFNWAGFGLSELLPRRARLWGRPSYSSLAKEIMKKARRFLNNTYEFNTHGWTEDDYLACATRLRQMEPDLIRGYAFALYLLAKISAQHGITDIRPRAVITTAQTLYSDWREEIGRSFSRPVFDQYGGSECHMVACECDTHECYHVQDEHVIVELLPSDEIPSNYRKIIVTDLDNYAQPFIRYEIEDLAEPFYGECSCGRCLTTMKAIVGRSQDIIRSRDGRIFSVHIMNLRVFEGIEQFQVIQESLDRIRVKIVASDRFNSRDRMNVQKRLDSIFSDCFSLDVEYVKNIPPSKSGKAKIMISNLNKI